jgi:hypothetical protein
VRPAVDGVDGVGEGIDRLVVRVGELDCRFHTDVIHHFFAVNNRVQVHAVAVEVAHERGQAAFEVEGHFAAAALVIYFDCHLARDESHLAETLDQRVELEVHFALEDGHVEAEGGLGAGLYGAAFADLFDRLLRDAALVALEIDLTVTADFHLAPFRKRVDRRDAHAVQAARDLVAARAELSARVQDGHHHFQRGFFLLGMDVHRDTAPVIFDRDRAILVDGNQDMVARTGQGFVDRVIHNLIDQVMQGLQVGAAHVHAGAASNGFQPFQNLDIFRAVCAVDGCGQTNLQRLILPLHKRQAGCLLWSGDYFEPVRGVVTQVMAPR